MRHRSLLQLRIVLKHGYDDVRPNFRTLIELISSTSCPGLYVLYRTALYSTSVPLSGGIVFRTPVELARRVELELQLLVLPILWLWRPEIHPDLQRSKPYGTASPRHPHRSHPVHAIQLEGQQMRQRHMCPYHAAITGCRVLHPTLPSSLGADPFYLRPSDVSRQHDVVG